MNVAVHAALLIWLAGVNVVTFALYGIDKHRAKKGRWRIPERTLLSPAACWAAVWAAYCMALSPQKTRHWYFRVACR